MINEYIYNQPYYNSRGDYIVPRRGYDYNNEFKITNENFNNIPEKTIDEHEQFLEHYLSCKICKKKINIPIKKEEGKITINLNNKDIREILILLFIFILILIFIFIKYK